MSPNSRCLSPRAPQRTRWTTPPAGRAGPGFGPHSRRPLPETSRTDSEGKRGALGGMAGDPAQEAKKIFDVRQGGGGGKTRSPKLETETPSDICKKLDPSASRHGGRAGRRGGGFPGDVLGARGRGWAFHCGRDTKDTDKASSGDDEALSSSLQRICSRVHTEGRSERRRGGGTGKTLFIKATTHPKTSGSLASTVLLRCPFSQPYPGEQGRGVAEGGGHFLCREAVSTLQKKSRDGHGHSTTADTVTETHRRGGAFSSLRPSLTGQATSQSPAALKTRGHGPGPPASVHEAQTTAALPPDSGQPGETPRHGHTHTHTRSHSHTHTLALHWCHRAQKH